MENVEAEVLESEWMSADAAAEELPEQCKHKCHIKSDGTGFLVYSRQFADHMFAQVLCYVTTLQSSAKRPLLTRLDSSLPVCLLKLLG